MVERLVNDAFTAGGPAPGSIAIERLTDAQGVVVALHGELDLATARELELHLREIEATHPGRLVIDLTDLEFMDSTGLAVMIRAHQSATPTVIASPFVPGRPRFSGCSS